MKLKKKHPPKRQDTLCTILIRTILSILFLCPWPGLSEAGEINARTVSYAYDMFSKGDKIGNISVSKTTGPEPRRVESSTNIEVGGFWGKWSLSAKSTVVLDKDGLLRFDHAVSENGDNWRISGERKGGELWCRARKVLTQSEREDNDVVKLAASVAARKIPYAGEVMTVASLLGADADEEGDLRIPVDSFDAAYGNLPQFLMKSRFKNKKLEARILDSTELSIKTVIFEQKEKKEFSAAGRSFKCRIFSTGSSGKKSVYWIAEDAAGAFLAKETGKDEDGPYEVRLTKYTAK